jgi:L-ascorbate metabolism protein UlaG (beta-lactamase superfamily)
LGFVLHAAGRTAWFAGDTGLFPGLDEVGPVDVALVPVGGWGPTLGPHHLDPTQAASAVQRVGAAHAVPVHYGTYWPAGLRRTAPALFRARCSEPGERFAAAARGFTPHVIAPGESVTL